MTACTRSPGGSCAIDPSAAEDAVQDTLVRAWRNLRALRDPDRFEAWLHRPLVNACRGHARPAERRPIEVNVLPIDRADRPTPVLTHYLGYQALRPRRSTAPSRLMI
jgi:DNA-directed RNA polymerase specialized sigma24 family protein